MKLLMVCICLLQELYAVNENFKQDNDSTRFWGMSLIIRSDTNDPNYGKIRLPFSSLRDNTQLNNFDFTRVGRPLHGITIRVGSPFKENYPDQEQDSVNVYIACRNMIGRCPHCPASFRNNLSYWEDGEVGIFYRWSSWKNGSCSFVKTNFSQLPSPSFAQMHKSSSFYVDPKGINAHVLQTALSHRIERRPTFNLISLGRSFVHRPF